MKNFRINLLFSAWVGFGVFVTAMFLGGCAIKVGYNKLEDKSKNYQYDCRICFPCVDIGKITIGFFGYDDSPKTFIYEYRGY